MTLREVNDPKHWRDCAAKMRVSDMMTDPEVVAVMLRLADDYDKLADRARVKAATSHRPVRAL